MSNIDPTVPISGSTPGPSTKSVRDNFAIAAAEIDAATAAAAAALPKSGGAMTGPLVLAADPAAPMQPVTLQYFGAHLPTVPGASTTPPLMDGVVSIGTSFTYARADHVHPTDTSRAPIDSPTFTGTVTLPGNPSTALGAAPKQYVDTMLPIAGGTMTGPIALAADPATNMQASTKQYVDAQVAGATGASSTNTGRNLLHNPLLNIAQRGVGPFTVNGYTLDRWLLSLATDTASITQQAATDAMRSQVGDEAMTSVLRNVFTGNAAAGAYNYIAQRIEGVRRLGSKTVTISFYALAGAGTLNLGIGVAQVFGTGGSPSAGLNMNGQSVAVGSAAVQRYSKTFAIPSTAGKVLGTNGDDYTQVSLWFSCGSTNATIAGNPGVQSGTIYLWGAQVEAGPISALEKPDAGDDLLRCLRFYQYHTNLITFSGWSAAGANIITAFPHGVRMRGALAQSPSAVLDTPQYLNASGALVASYPTYTRLQCVATATGLAWAAFNLALSADL